MNGNTRDGKKEVENKLEEIKISPQSMDEVEKIEELTWQEKKYLLHVERGDIASIHRLFDTYYESGNLNTNCVDPLGRSALVIAIENENYELTELLLSFGVKPQNALLHAIKEEYVEAVELLLEYEERIHTSGQPYSWETVDDEISTYTRDITPLILAAQTDNYEILKILLDRGATLPSPHDVRCGCDECIEARKKDCLRHSKSRLSAYTALSSPSLIALSSKDPILTAFELTDELRRLATMENEFKFQYQALAKKSQNFVTALLDHTRTSEELEIILNYDQQDLCSEVKGRMKLQRIKQALGYRQKQFVAHPHVQQLLASVWYEGMPGFRRKGLIRQTFEVCKMGLLFPLYCILYMTFPKTSFAQRLEDPFTKFICHSSSYLFFLLLLVLESQNVEEVVIEVLGSDTMVSKLHKTQQQQRGSLPSYVEVAIIIYIFGFIWWEVKKIWESGFHEYAKDMWHLVEFIINALYILWLGLRIASYLQISSEMAAGINPHLPREEWDAFDPQLISEGIFGAANIFSFLKLVHIFSVNPYLGPLQVSLGRMVFDILKFFFLYTLVVFAFGCGMNQLLWYYADMDYRACQNLPDDQRSPHEDGPCKVWRRFSNLFETSQTLFWATFGLIDLENFDLSGIKGYTRYWGLLMFGCYSIINIVVLLNLLIAMMSNSYNIISMRSDMEWKFARSKLWMSYFEDGGVLPPPFNIIPSFRSIWNLCCCICRNRKRKGTIRRKFFKDRDRKYQRVMRSIVRRYITTQQRRNDNKDVTEDDVNELKHEVSSFRCEMIDILKKNGWQVENEPTNISNSVGKRERQKERRLLKGFTVGLFETVLGVMKDSNLDNSNSFHKSFLRRASSRQRHVKKNWNDIVSKIKENQNHIGFSRGDSIRHSIDTLRKEVLLEEQRISSQRAEIKNKRAIGNIELRGRAKFAAVARSLRLRDIPDEVFWPLESEEESVMETGFNGSDYALNKEQCKEKELPVVVPLEINTIITTLKDDDAEKKPSTVSSKSESNRLTNDLKTKEGTSTNCGKLSEAERTKYAVKPLDRKPEGGWM